MRSEARTFPVLCQRRDRPPSLPRSVPWDFAERFRGQAEVNHGQTLERLAERGGLCPEEMWVAAHGLRLFPLPPAAEAVSWLVDAVARFEAGS